jgi:signal transduction histidine kinase
VPLATEVLAAGWPLALLLAGMLMRARERRRRLRARAGEALHELRRPLQTLALLTDRGAAAQHVEMVAGALTDLERALLGRRPDLRVRTVTLRPVVEAAVERWRLSAAGEIESPGAVELRWLAGEVRAVVDPRRIAQAMDNLIANALEHGRSPVILEATRTASGLRLSVRNRIAGHGPPALPRPHPQDPTRRGHGLRIVSEIAVDHGGRFLFDCARGWAVGTLELPLSGGVPEAVAA